MECQKTSRDQSEMNKNYYVKQPFQIFGCQAQINSQNHVIPGEISLFLLIVNCQGNQRKQQRGEGEIN